MKRVAFGLAALFAIVAIAGLFSACVNNPRVVRELREQPDGDRAKKVMLLTLPSGKTLPVNYLHEGDKVYAASDFLWHRELRDGPGPVTLLLQGRELRGRARIVDREPEYRADVFSRLRPSAPGFTGVMVEIQLD